MSTIAYRELIAMAAKAAGYSICSNDERAPGAYVEINGSVTHWNPVHDDGDALRLAVHLRMPIWFDERSTTADQRKCGDHGWRVETGLYDLGGYAATRLAIVRAAADRTTEQGASQCE